MNDEDLLDALVSALDTLAAILPEKKAEWDSNLVVRLAVERMWINIGNASELYRRTAGIAGGVEPWAEMAGLRNLLAHALPGDVSSDRIWADTTADLPRIAETIRELRGRIDPDRTES